MITITKLQAATDKFFKLLRNGKEDVITADQIAPSGIDSKPVKGSNVIHADTAIKGEGVALGLLYSSEKTNEGETRIYATDENGNEVFDLYLKNDGTMEISGSGDNLIKYLALNTALQSFVTDLNSKLGIAFTAVGGSWPGTSIDISNSRIEKVKTGL